jgi:hypothetical protein
VHLERDGQVSELQVDIPDSALSIQGRVLDEDELPIADAWVTATRSDLGVVSSPNDSRTLTDEQGSFALHELAPGS